MDVFEEHAIRTTGDAVQDRRLAEIGGKGLFAKEIHEALADRRIDFAVHSLKDLETDAAARHRARLHADARGRARRADPRQRSTRRSILPIRSPACRPGRSIGTSSVRRQAQLLHARPDLAITTLRGNVQTRLDKLAAGDCAASLLAYAGLKRLGLAERASVVLDPDAMVPAAGQGIIGITVREDDTELRELLAAIEDPEAKAVSTAERAMLLRLDGSCRTPIGGHARLLPNGELHLTGLVARGDGSFLLKRSLHGAGRRCRTDRQRTGRQPARRQPVATSLPDAASRRSDHPAGTGCQRDRRARCCSGLSACHRAGAGNPHPAQRHCRRRNACRPLWSPAATPSPALPASHHHLPLFAVGEATAARARAAGFAQRLQRRRRRQGARRHWWRAAATAAQAPCCWPAAEARVRRLPTICGRGVSRRPAGGLCRDAGDRPAGRCT